MSIIAKQSSEFHDHVPHQSTTTIKVLPVKQQHQQQLAKENQDRKGEVNSHLSYTGHPKPEHSNCCGNAYIDKDLPECEPALKNVSENILENINRYDSCATEADERNLNNVKTNGNNKNSSLNWSKENIIKDSCLLKEQKSLVVTSEVNENLTKQDFLPSTNLQHFIQTSENNDEKGLFPLKRETNFIEIYKHSDECVKSETDLSLKKETEQSIVSSDVNCTVDIKRNLHPSSGLIEGQDDDLGRKATSAPEDREELNSNKLQNKVSDLTSLISSQRETILKLRREERLSEERNFEPNIKKEIGIKNVKHLESQLSSKVTQFNVPTESKSFSKSEKVKQKKIRKKRLYYSSFNDLFSEPLNVRNFYSDMNQKREKKIPSKFLYLSKMEKYLSHSNKTKYKRKSKSRYKQADKLTNKIKVERQEVEKEFVNVFKDVNEIKIFKMKDEKKGLLRKDIKVEKQAKTDHNFSGNKFSSKSSILSKRFSQLRDDRFHQHCLQRYYRLKPSNWNCSSTSALQLLKRKYNSIRLLFDKEPIVCLKKLKLKESCVHLIKDTYSNGECNEMLSPWTTMVTQESETPVNQLKGDKSLMQIHSTNSGIVSDNLVDPRVMSLSKTLLSTSNGKVGLEKTFKNCNSKSLKKKKKENNSRTHGDFVKKKGKPDWLKWKEKLKEASNRMVGRKKDGLIIEKKINTFPSSFIKNCQPSIMNFRIPLKSSNKAELEENKILSKGNPLKSLKNEEISKDLHERDGSQNDIRMLKVDTVREVSNVLKDINEELTLEEFESDKIITYSINGYSIEIGRDSPIDTPVSGSNKTPVQSECFDEDEMNKILYGDNLDEVSLDCHIRNVQEHFNDTDTGLTVTSDIIPNLYAQEEIFVPDDENFTGNMDKSPPVLERSVYNTEPYVDESDNTYIVRINEVKQEIGDAEEMIDVECNDGKSESFYCDNANVMDNEELITTNPKNGFEVRMDSDCEDTDDTSLDQFPTISVSSNQFYNGNEKQEGTLAISYNDHDNCDESFNNSSFITENVCTLDESTHDYNEFCDKQDYFRSNDPDYEIATCIKDTKTSNDLSNENTILIKNEEHSVQSLDNLEIFKMQDDRIKSQEKVDLCTGLTELKSKMTRCVAEVNMQESDKVSVSLNTKQERSQSLTNLSKKEIYADSYVDKTNEVKNIESKLGSNTSDKKVKKNHKSPEKSAAAVMKDLEKLWKVMKTSDQENQVHSVANARKSDKSDHNMCFSEKLRNIGKLMLLKGCANKDGNAAEMDKNVSDFQVENDTSGNGISISEDGEKQSDRFKSLSASESDSKNVSAVHDQSIQATNLNDTIESEIRKERDEFTPVSSIEFGHVDRMPDESGNADIVENEEKLTAESSFGIEESDVTCLVEDNLSVQRNKEVKESKPSQTKQRKRKISSDIQTSCENQHSLSEDNMEQADERIMCDFPNHNWLFNKYNISEVRPEKEIFKDGKGKKQIKNFKDVTKHSKEVKYRRKSSYSTASVSPTQMKNKSRSKSDNFSESRNFHKGGITIKWNKVKKMNSLSDNVNFDKKIDIITEKSDDIIFDKNKCGFSAEDSGQLDGKSSENGLFIKSTISSVCSKSINTTAGVTLLSTANLSTEATDINQIMHYNKSLSNEKAHDVNDVEQSKISSSDLMLIESAALVENTGERKTDTSVAENVENSDSIERKLIGELIDDEEEDEDDDVKLQIDETVTTEDGTEDGSNVEKLSEGNIEEADIGEQKSTEKREEKAFVIDEGTAVIEKETKQISVSNPFERTLVSVSSPTVSSATSTSFDSKTIKVTSTPDIIPAEVIPSKNIGHLDTIKSEPGSINFRPRTKPPVQLVHPQVHKPPTGKVKLEASKIQTNVSFHTIDNKEEQLPISTNADKHTDSEISSGHVSKSNQIQSNLEPSVTFASDSQLAASQIPVTGLSTLTQLSSGSITATSTSTSNFGNGMVIPIQPFVQNIPNTIQPGYVQSMPQIVQIQSSSIDPICQQSSPMHIQSQLIPVTIYQAGKQTLISNYSYTNAVSEQLLSDQSNNIQGQSVNFNMNQTQINTAPVQIPICRPVNSAPPPLLILPKPSNLASFNQQGNKPYQAKMELQSCKKQSKFPFKYQRNMEQENEENQDNASKQKVEKEDLSTEKIDNGIDSEEVHPSDLGTKEVHSRNSENIEGEVDDEIKRQMEELDKEIKRKEQEQEEMRRKKIELLEKMKQAKNKSKLKETEADDISDGKCEQEKDDKDHSKFEIEIVSITESENKGGKRKVIKSANEGEKTEVIQTSEEEKTDEMRLVPEKEVIGKDNEMRCVEMPCKDVVLSEFFDEADDDVFDSDTPIDLSSALKSNKINKFSTEKLSVTVSDGIISIKETNNNDDSLLSVKEAKGNLSNGNKCEYECLEEENSSVVDSFPENRCDGMNYIEDIGLVNPFTGEYEINEDGEGVEYLDLSTSRTENISKDEYLDKSDNIENEKMIRADETSDKTAIHSNLENQTDPKEKSVKDNDAPAVEVASEEMTTEKMPVSSSNVIPMTSVSDTIVQSSSTMTTSTKSVVSIDDSYAVSSEGSLGVTISTDSSPLFTSSFSSSFLSSKHSPLNNDNCNVGEIPLNLRTNKRSISQKSSVLMDESGFSEMNCKKSSGTNVNLHWKNTPEPIRSEAIQSSTATPQSQCVNRQIIKENMLKEKEEQTTNLPVAQNTLPVLQSSPSNEHIREKFSSFRKVMHNQNKQAVAQGNDFSFETAKQIAYKQNYKMTSNTHLSRGLSQRKRKEKFIELKPAHYRSPPRKIHKGVKPLPAHHQSPTSRETMKKMSKTFSQPHVTFNSSPFLSKKHPVYLSPKEILKPAPKLWEKRPPKPAHNKRPFGIAGHLIVQSARKYSKQEASVDWTPSPRFYSLPSTPTTTGTTPPRATSADCHGSYCSFYSSDDSKISSSSTLDVSSASSQKTVENHGAQVGLPSPIRAHCRPKSLVTSNQFYETSVLRPPALLKNSKPQEIDSRPEVIEVIDLTADVPATTSDSGVRLIDSPKSKERAIQKELNHAVSKRQRLDNTEAPTTEKINIAGRNAAARLQHQLLGQINARQRLMPPPPYTGRQRMPVLVQVPRQPVIDQQPRMQYTRRMDPQFDEKRKHISQNIVQSEVQRFPKPQEMIQIVPQVHPQVWPANHNVHSQGANQYTPTHPQVIGGNEHFVPNQEANNLRMAARQMHPGRGLLQTGNGSNMGFTGNTRMQHPNSGNVNNQLQTDYPVRGQSLPPPYTTTHNQTQIMQLLQQPHPNTQMMQRGNISPQVMQRERIESSPQLVQRGEVSPQIMHRGEMSPRTMQRGEIMPQMMQRGEISPQMIHRGQVSPQIMHRGDVSPQLINRGETSPQTMQRALTNPQVNRSVSPHEIQRGTGSQMQVMQNPNNQMMATGEYNQKVMYTAGNNGSRTMKGTSPQLISPNGIPQQSFQRSPIPSDNQVNVQSSVATTITQEQVLQRMKQIRAQHIRSQQIQNRVPQGVGFEQRARMPDTRTQLGAIEQNNHLGSHVNSTLSPQQINGAQQMIGSHRLTGSQHVNSPQEMIIPQQVSGPQPMIGSQQNTGVTQMAAFNMGVLPQSARSQGPSIQASTYPQQISGLEPQIQQGFHLHQGQQRAELGNKVPIPYMMSTSVSQQNHFQQNGMQSNTISKNSSIQRHSAYTSNQNMHLQSKTSPSGLSQHQNMQSQGHGLTQIPSTVLYQTQSKQVKGHIENRSHVQGNVSYGHEAQHVQGHPDGKVQSAFLQNKAGQGVAQNSNWKDQNSMYSQTSYVSKNGQMAMGHQQLFPIPGLNQASTVVPHLQPSVGLTTPQVNTQSSIPLNLATNKTNQSATVANTQVLPLGSQGLNEGQRVSKVEEELPHLQQIHGECFMCGKYSLYLCSNCKKIWYCSPECQLTHWQTHADECEGQTD